MLPIEQWIVFETDEWLDGELIHRSHEARVDTTPVPRSRLSKGQLVIEHSSGAYAIYIDIRGDGEYVANPIDGH